MLRNLSLAIALLLTSLGVAFGESASSIPTRVPIYWGASASPSLITCPIPNTSQIPITVGRASWPDGFPPATFLPSGAGGVPPFGQDMNGVLCQVSQWTRWMNAGGAVTYDNTFQSAIGGYPKNAIIASGTISGAFWLSTIDNNTSNPDSGGANWLAINPAATPATGQVYFSFIGSTQVKLCPKDGSNLVVNKIVYLVSSSCIVSNNSGVFVNSAGGQTLSANTIYDVFMFVNSGTLTFDFWSTASNGHIADTTAGNTGIEVRNNSGTPDSTRSYVGKVAMNASGQFQAQGTGTISWFNQIPVTILGAVIAGPTSVGSVGELSSAARTPFLTFGSRSLMAYAYAGTAVPGTNGVQALLEVGLDLSIPGSMPGRTQTNVGMSLNGIYSGSTTEGGHYFTVLGQGDVGFAASFTNYKITAQVWG